jgi:endonuclease/exonuclease/phosphatase (EEP) superfamily protein YafD
MERVSIHSYVATPQGEIELLALHPFPSASPSGYAAWKRELTAASDRFPESDLPFVVAGDLNTTVWSPTYRAFVAKLGLSNARRGYGMQPTWPTGFPSLLRLPIDHVLVSSAIQVAGFAVGPDVSSDHLPVLADLVIGE